MKIKRFVLYFTVLLLLVGCGKKNVRWQEAYDLGVKYLSDGHYNAAVEQFTLAIEIDPRNPKGYTGRADVYIEAARLVYAENPEDERVTRYLDFAQADYARAQELDASIVMPTADWFVPRPAAEEPENRQTESAEMPEIGEPELSRMRNVISEKWALGNNHVNHSYFLEFGQDGTATLSVGWCSRHLFANYTGSYTVLEAYDVPETDGDFWERNPLMRIRLQIPGGPGFDHDFFQPDIDEILYVCCQKDVGILSLVRIEEGNRYPDESFIGGHIDWFETNGQMCYFGIYDPWNDYHEDNICNNRAEELARERLGMPVHGIDVWADEYYLSSDGEIGDTPQGMDTLTMHIFHRGRETINGNIEDHVYVNDDTGEALLYWEIPEPYRESFRPLK